MAQLTFREANKRYRRAFIPAMVVYTVAVFGGSFLLKQFETPPTWLSAIVALIMAAPIGVVLWLMWRLTRETDAVRIEKALIPLFARETWAQLSHLMIWHGRRTCDARKPRCNACVLADICPSYHP